ncbi:hypothetical protein AB0M29_42200 [Streptomyces sp. NPDC051976]|uniref:hypothetical protein n=1 Tax=Streptomyces sp. NPDC051976 TaxID=3154947 RepID=UPI00344AF404
MPRFSLPPRVSARTGLLWALAALVPGAVGLAYYEWRTPDLDTVPLQLAGTEAAALVETGARTAAFRRALEADFALLTCSLVTLVLVFLLGRYAFTSRRGQSVAHWAVGTALLGWACGLAENILLVLAVDGHAHGDRPYAVATTLATVKWLLLAAVGLLAFVVWVTTVSRTGRSLLYEPWQRLWRGLAAGVRRLLRLPAREPAPPPPAHDHPADRPEVVPPRPVIRSDGSRWPTVVTGLRKDPAMPQAAHWRCEGRSAPGRTGAALGFCVSGGGIRSACVTLGALQSLRRSLLRARYLVSVSGGGYTVGAMQLALAGAELEAVTGTAPDPGDPLTAPGHDTDPLTAVTAEDVFEPGSPEEDHLRRHSKYVADGTGEWTVALGVLLRGLLASLFLLAATTATLGLGLSWAYHHVPVTDLSALVRAGGVFCRGCAAPERPMFRHPAVWSVLVVLMAAAATWLLWLLAYAWLRVDRLGAVMARLFQALVVLAVALSAVVVFVPLLAWLTVAVQSKLDVGRPDAAAGAGLTVLLTYVAALVSTLWRRRETLRGGLSKVLDTVRGRPGLSRAVPNGLVQYVVVWLVLVLLAVAFLYILGFTTATGWDWPHWAQIGIPAMLLFLGVSLDQTWMGLHPFYRRRLSAAFAVRRVTGADGVEVAAPFDFDNEVTALSRYGARQRDFPQVIFAAAANLSGSDRTPPGRRAVSFTLSHDYVGGPDVGYACTTCLERRTKRHIARDLTVESAVAVSGAAFSSAMGAQARAFQTLFALSNARLGTWLPNPGALAELWKDGGRWELPPQQVLRRLPYLLREVLGRYPMDDRLLLVTDGGHYENLGLVELLRQGVRTAVCVDASGDVPPFATTLAQAIALAREELGITITLHDPTSLAPGSADPLEPESTLSALNSRLSKTAVVTGDILYPRNLTVDGGPPSPHGTLIVARSTLTAELPYDLLSYAASNPVFPHDSTSDQWFDHQQFDAYQSLGRYIGARVQALLDDGAAGGPPLH